MAEALLADADVIVVGAGLGGGIAARALAEAGLSVLVVEKGDAGLRAEETPLNPDIRDPVARRLRGFWPDPAETEVDGRRARLFLPLGSGVGGSSVFYAATLERPARHDIEEMPGRPHPTGGWPMGWSDLAPWFDEAEHALFVHGEPDPLDDRPEPRLAVPPPPAPDDAAIMRHLTANGMHPYRLHGALAHLPGCAECFGRKCPRPCKMDGRSAGIEPALATGRARILTGAAVTRILMRGRVARGVEIVQDGAARRLFARHVVLAAGALSSPGVLLASADEDWPQGVGNGAGLVGRHLMFHLNEMFALWPGRAAGSGASKAVGFRDLYHAQGHRLGMVQAMGVAAGEGEILHYLRQRAAERGLTGRLPREGLRLPAALAARMLGTARLFVGLLEDLPDRENRVTADPAHPGRIAFTYRTAPEADLRRRLFRRLIRQAFRGRRILFLSDRAEPNLGHACGTLRMGRDAGAGVTDAFGRVHGTANLWVADASVFPTSMGVNPGLTIAALALRQADRIERELRWG
ncbi:MAG: GMC family oxidoreductase [Rubellimicrobium sp.]|nr:GMC family oxidoreductase [Rubellimicrobium sp.]